MRQHCQHDFSRYKTKFITKRSGNTAFINSLNGNVNTQTWLTKDYIYKFMKQQRRYNRN